MKFYFKFTEVQFINATARKDVVIKSSTEIEKTADSVFIILSFEGENFS